MAAVWCHWAMLLRGLSCTGSLTFFLIAVTVLPTELMLHAYALTPWILGHVLGTDMVARAHKSRCYDNAGAGLGSSFYISNEEKSVVHSHPPSHCMRTHALGWPYWFHALHARQFQCMCPSHLGRPYRVSAFAALHLQAFNWRSVVCHLWHPAESQGFCEELWIVEPNIDNIACACTRTSDRCVLEEVSVTQLHSAFLLQVTLVLWGVSRMTQHRLYLRSSLVNIFMAFFPLPVRRVFLWKKKRNPAGAHHMWIHSGLWTQDAFYLRKHNESEPNECGRILAAGVFFEKTRNVGAVGRASFKFTVTLNARRILPQKTQGFWGGSVRREFSLKTIRNSGAVGLVSFKFTVTLNTSRTLCGIYNGFSGFGGGLGRGCTLIRRCTRHLMPGILDRMACGVALALAIGGGAMCRRPTPGGKKTALFWRVFDVHKTSQIPSKMALGRG